MAEVDLTVQNFEYGVCDLLRSFLLHDVASATGFEDTFGIQRFFVHGDDQNREMWVCAVQIMQKVEAAFSRETYIEQHEIGIGLIDAIRSLSGIGRMAANKQAGYFFDDLNQAIAKDGMIIDNEHASAGRGWMVVRVGGCHG